MSFTFTLVITALRVLTDVYNTQWEMVSLEVKLYQCLLYVVKVFDVVIKRVLVKY